MKNKDMTKIAVVYARYSSSGQREESIDGQLAAAKKYAEAKGYTIIHEYIDRAKTGRNDEREAFQQMLSDTAKKTFSVIIVWKVDRFGRNREEITFNKYRCKKNGVRVEYVAENMPDGPESVILESVLEGMAEYYSLQLSQNVKRGLLENAKQHKAVNGTPPLGYRLTPDKFYEIDPDTAPLAKLIFEKYANGETTAEINRYLNAKGYKTPRGLPFSKSSLQKMLKNEKYIGIYAFKDIIWDEDAIPALIDKEVFYKVQGLIESNRRRPPKRYWNYTDYILTEKLFCGHCGEKMLGESGSGKSGRKYNYYTCYNRKKKQSCDKKPIRQDIIEPAVLEAVQTLVKDDALMEQIAEATWQYYLSVDTDQEEIDVLQKQLTQAENGIANLVKSIEAGLFNDAIKRRMDELEGEKAALLKALGEKQLSMGFKLTKDHILYFLEQFKNLDVTDRECQRKLVNTFVNAIYLFDDHFKIAFNYTGDNTTTITLKDIEKATTSEVFGRCCKGVGDGAASEHLTHIGPMTAPLNIAFFKSVFIITYELPRCN